MNKKNEGFEICFWNGQRAQVHIPAFDEIAEAARELIVLSARFDEETGKAFELPIFDAAALFIYLKHFSDFDIRPYTIHVGMEGGDGESAEEPISMYDIGALYDDLGGPMASEGIDNQYWTIHRALLIAYGRMFAIYKANFEYEHSLEKKLTRLLDTDEMARLLAESPAVNNQIIGAMEKVGAIQRNREQRRKGKEGDNIVSLAKVFPERFDKDE